MNNEKVVKTFFKNLVNYQIIIMELNSIFIIFYNLKTRSLIYNIIYLYT